MIAVVEEFAGRLPPGGTVADLGCGTGQHAVALALRGFNMIAVDYAPAMLARARTYARVQSATVEFRELDLNEDLLFAAETLDGALCVSVMQVVDQPTRLLGQIREALRPGGYVLIESVRHLGALSCGDHLGARDRIINGAKKLAAKVPGAVKQYQLDDVAQLCISAGLEVMATNVYESTFTATARRT
jgi:2-polyprenyl-3-methyl-5-hydroxy-6-metoxy-1,4-benzoquinol methylase